MSVYISLLYVVLSNIYLEKRVKWIQLHRGLGIQAFGEELYAFII